MKIFIVTVQPFPHGLAGTERVICYAKALLSVGIDVEVVNFHRTEVYGRKPDNTIGVGIHEGIPFRYMGGTPLRGSNVVVRYINDWYDKKKLFRYLSQNVKKGDAILTYYRQNDIDKQLLPFAHKKGIKIYRDLCEYPYATSKINDKTEERCQLYMKSVFIEYDGAICISEALLNLAERYHPNGKHIKVPILIDESKWNIDDIKPKKFNAPYLFHSGTLFQQKDGIVDVLEAFADALPFLPKGTKYLFTGSVEKSVDADMIKSIILKNDLSDCVDFLGYLSREEMLEYALGAAAFVVCKNDNIQNRFCFATKLGEYLLTGNPVITTNVGEPKYFLKDGDSAYIIEPDNRNMLKEAMVRCLNYPDEAIMIGKRGQQVARNFFYTKAQGKVLKQYFCHY